jgi:hypothetical protein
MPVKMRTDAKTATRRPADPAQPRADQDADAQ